MKTISVIGRVMFGGFFLYSGINHLMKREQMSQYAGAKNVPEPDTAVVLSGLAMIVGGASVMLNLQPQMGAGLIASFLGGASPVMHDFWNSSDPGQRQNDMIHFSKNIALLGAALAITGVEHPWRKAVTAAVL